MLLASLSPVGFLLIAIAAFAVRACESA